MDKHKYDDQDENAGPVPAADLVARYQAEYRKLTCIAAGVLGHREDAEDMVQMAISIAIDKSEQFQSEGHFVAWLCTTVRNCALNQRRKIIGRKTTPSDPSVMAMTPDEQSNVNVQPISTTSGELLPYQEAFDDQVSTALQSLPEESRTCLLLRVMMNLSYAELSEIMGVPEGTAMSHVHRSKKKLRELLGESSNRQGGTI